MLTKIQTALQTCELKFASETDAAYKFSGYASTFNGVDSVDDTIVKGAFKSAEGKKIKMFVNHKHGDIPVGYFSNIKEDDKGLFVEGFIDKNHILGKSAYSALKNGTMDAMSIGFRIPKGGAEIKDDVRVIKNIDLREISIVNFPANEGARISVVKSDVVALESLKDVERFLCDTGNFSKSAATAFVSRVKSVLQSDFEQRHNDKITELNKEACQKEIDNAANHFVNAVKNITLE